MESAHAQETWQHRAMDWFLAGYAFLFLLCGNDGVLIWDRLGLGCVSYAQDRPGLRPNYPRSTSETDLRLYLCSIRMCCNYVAQVFSAQ